MYTFQRFTLCIKHTFWILKTAQELTESIKK